jgi:putative ABC transport system permease protein
LVALVLAGFGIYGTVLYSVGQRAREVGIRMALGARARDVTSLIVRQEMVPVALGMGMGLLGAVALSHLLDSFLFGVTSHDLPTFAAVALCLGLVAIAGCLAPARRAAGSQPVTTLRSE